MMLSLSQKIRSYFYPVLVRKAASAVNPVLELYYYRNRWQLGTPDALYSDGIKYRPLVAAFASLEPQLPRFQKVLVLGTGLGSAVHLLHQYHCKPSYTLVDLDAVVLQWAMEFMPPSIKKDIIPVCADAGQFLERLTASFDLIIVDVFKGRQVPDFVTSTAFIENCKAHLLSQGRLIMNYIANRPGDEDKAKAALEAAFSEVKVLSFHINRVFIARA